LVAHMNDAAGCLLSHLMVPALAASGAQVWENLTTWKLFGFAACRAATI
jgi:hypothetical protein